MQTRADIGVEKNSTILLTDVAGLFSRLPGSLGQILPPTSMITNGHDAEVKVFASKD